MATVRSVEKAIFNVERFHIRFHIRFRFEGPARARGRDVRGDKQMVATYAFQRAAADSMTVAAWVSGRFRRRYPGFAVDVLDGAGRVVHGQALLKTVRATYQ